MSSKNSILVVDDSDLIRQLLKKIISEYDLEVIACKNGLEGIQKAIECNPSLIFLDLLMPNFDGIKMLQVIKVIEAVKHIPVIVISGNTTKTNVMSAMEAGADKVLSKPLKPEIIIKTIDEMLGENFLQRKTLPAKIESDDQEIQEHLNKIFMENFQQKKKTINAAIDSKNKDLISTVVHDLKGTGGNVGLASIGIICSDIERALAIKNIDWEFVALKCRQMYGIVERSELKKHIMEF